MEELNVFIVILQGIKMAFCGLVGCRDAFSHELGLLSHPSANVALSV